MDDLIAAGAKALIERSWEEAGRWRDLIPLAPDYDTYGALAKAGRLATLGLRDSGALRGYGAYLIGPHPMYATTVHALCQTLYVEPGPARRMVAAMVAEAERMAAVRASPGTARVVYYVPVQSRFNLLLDRLGYARTEIVREKLVGE